MSVINTNYLSLVAQNNLQKSQSALGTAIERLSSGLRINSAKDDAAGQAIANRMTAQVNGLNQAQRNANDGISVAQTAEGALNQVNDNLQRIRELSVQAANGTNSSDDLQSIQDEINQRLTEINRISEETDFNGVKVLNTNEALKIQVGANDSQEIEVNLSVINKTTLDLENFQVTKNNLNVSDEVKFINNGAAGVFGEADLSVAALALTELLGETVGADNLTLREVLAADGSGSGTGDYVIEYNGEYYAALQQAASGSANAENFTVAAVDNANGDATAVKVGVQDTSGTLSNSGFIEEADGSFSQATWTGGVAGTWAATFADADAVVTATGAGAAATTTNFNGAATINPLAKLDAALKTVDSLRSELGAVQNRFESAITNLQTNSTNLQAARSRIEDADYATEVANMSKNQILQQAGTSVLAQANQIPQGVLSLLR